MQKWFGVRWMLIGWTFVISAIAYLDRVNISIAGTNIAADYKLSNIQLGYVFSAFVLGYALFQAPGGRLADRLGPRWMLTGGVVWWGIFTTLSALVPTSLPYALSLLIVTRFALGTGEAVVYPSTNRLVAEWIPTHERGLANGWIFAGVGAGAGVTPPLIVYIIEHYGWRWSFGFSAVLGILAGLVWFIIARDRPAEHPFITQEEKNLIAAGLSGAKNTSGGMVSWGTILSSKTLWAMTLSYFAYGYAAYIFFTWFFIYLSKVRGLDLKSSRYYAMLPFIAMAICSPLGGWLSDKISAKRGDRVGRCWLAVIAMALSAIFIAMGTQVASAKLASFVLAGGAGALYLSQSSFWAVSAGVAGRSAGAVSGFMNMGSQIGGAVTASLSPWIADHFGWTASFLTAAGLCVGGSILWVFVDPDRKLSPTSS